MENQEDKKACCSTKENCNHLQSNCCSNWRSCRAVKIIFAIIVILIVFCLGTKWGEYRCDMRGDRYERGGMMNWKSDRFDKRVGPNQNEVINVSAPATNIVE